jgi:hypothetical protein
MQSLQKLDNIDLRRGVAIDLTKKRSDQPIAGQSFNPLASVQDFLKPEPLTINANLIQKPTTKSPYRKIVIKSKQPIPKELDQSP